MMADQQENLAAYYAELDITSLAHKAVKEGIISQDLLDQLTSLHSQVPNSMKHRYLFRHIFEAVKDNEHLFMRLVQMLIQFQSCASKNLSRPENVLSSEHISSLVEFLSPHAYKWEFIGTALKFQPQDLRNIRANNAVMGTHGLERNLNEMVEVWVEKKHGHTLPPTVENLEKSLNSPLVGLGVLASDVRSKFAPQQQHSCIIDYTLPYYLANVHFKTSPTLSLSHILYSRNILNQIEIEEGKSALLECQVTTDGNQNVGFEFHWLRNGKDIVNNSKHMKGVNTPTLCIYNADISMDGSQYSCRVVPIAPGKRYIITTPVILRVHCKLERDIPALSSLYLSKPEVPDEWPPVNRSKYINLALIKQKKTTYGTEYARLTIRGDMDDILQHKEKIDYHEMLKSLRHGQCLFIEGRPGCGKTTFVHKISQDWVKTTFHRTMRLVLLVSLRVLNNLCKPKLEISDILGLFENLKVTEEELLAREGKGCVLHI